MANTKDPSPGIKPHPLVAALQPDPSKAPMRTIKLSGFPGTSTNRGATRLWLDSDLRNYVDIPNEAIHHSSNLPDDGGTMVWISPDAQLTYGGTSDAATVSQFLTGSIASQHLSTASPAGVAGVGGARPEGISLGAPCLSFPINCPPSLGFCPSLGCPSRGLCPSVHTPCASLIGCPSHQIVCHPSLATCPSVVNACLTQQIVCQISVTGCPSRQFICPTGPVVCQISSGLTCPSRFCPSANIPCFSLPCPSTACPSLECGGPQGFGGQE
jgi:hypothetical protein